MGLKTLIVATIAYVMMAAPAAQALPRSLADPDSLMSSLDYLRPRCVKNRILFNDEGEPIGKAFDIDCDGDYDYAEAYDRQGRLTARIHANSNVGVYWVTYWTYDGHGRLIKREFDIDDDKKPESVMEWHYDEDGNLLRQTYDWDGDGTIDQVIEEVER